MEQVFLSRKNLEDLLRKLDNPMSARSIIKSDTTHPKYPCSVSVLVTAVENKDYYTDRRHGETADDLIARVAEYTGDLTSDALYVHQMLCGEIGYLYIEQSLKGLYDYA